MMHLTQHWLVITHNHEYWVHLSKNWQKCIHHITVNSHCVKLHIIRFNSLNLKYISHRLPVNVKKKMHPNHIHIFFFCFLSPVLGWRTTSLHHTKSSPAAIVLLCAVWQSHSPLDLMATHSIHPWSLEDLEFERKKEYKVSMPTVGWS